MITNFKNLMLLSVLMLTSTGVFGVNFDDTIQLGKFAAIETQIEALEHERDTLNKKLMPPAIVPYPGREEEYKKDYNRRYETLPAELEKLYAQKEQLAKEIGIK